MITQVDILLVVLTVKRSKSTAEKSYCDIKSKTIPAVDESKSKTNFDIGSDNKISTQFDVRSYNLEINSKMRSKYVISHDDSYLKTNYDFDLISISKYVFYMLSLCFQTLLG